METLIDHTLTLAREGRDIGDPEPVSLRDTFARAWDAAPTSAAERRIRDPPERVLADPDRLVELFQNLVRNAVEHGRDGATPESGPAVDGAGAVTITLGATPDGFYVADDGPGIPPDQRDAVLESGYSTSDDGTGFGLSIVETIAEAHGWELKITDSEDGGASSSSAASRSRHRAKNRRRVVVTAASGMGEVRDGLRVRVVRDLVEAGEADAFELNHLVGVVVAQSRFGHA